ncbi:hypothetical protein PQQ96_21210 [Paraburkholderia sediminicola]
MPINFASVLRVCCLRYLSMRTKKGASVLDVSREPAAAVNEARLLIQQTV